MLRRAMLAATPKSLIFAPRPYPATVPDVMADLKFAFHRMFPDPAAGPENLQALVRGLDSDALRVEVTRVENWKPDRCSPERESMFYLLVRLFERSNGLELGRVAMFETGLLSMWIPAPPDASRESREEWSRQLSRPDEALTVARSQLRMSGRSAQWVATNGTGELYCPPLYPCVSFEAGGRSFIMARGGVVYEVLPGSPRTSVEAMKDDRSRQATLDALDPTTERLVSVGTDQWVLARRVTPGP